MNIKYSHWQIHTSARNEKNARVVLNRALQNMGSDAVDIGFNFDGEHGNLISFSIQHDVTEWGEFIYQILLLAQTVGFGWNLTGYIDQDPDASTEHTNLSGVSFIQWLVYKDGVRHST